MKVKFFITQDYQIVAEETITFLKPQEEYLLADITYLFALEYIRDHNLKTFDGIDYYWEEQKQDEG